jgi:prolyl-tRNA editing enzyme YbaK/EbsC (Cys-tRNA(Pro) deacylase)
MPPFGDARELPVIVDQALANDYIAFTIGTHRDLVRITFADFCRLARPVITSFTAPNKDRDQKRWSVRDGGTLA